MKNIYELIPVLQKYIWAGNKLKAYKDTALDAIAESWELSQLKEGHSLLKEENNAYELNQVFTPSDLGPRFSTFQDFPLLIKLIDSAKSLSIQVHPDDNYARSHENSNGKTEMWIILEAKEDAYIYLGLKETISKEELRKNTSDDRLLTLLNKVYVHPGDIYVIEPGTIHAIGEGITLCEIQQSSNITYRVYDFNRVDAHGNKRQLHIDNALDVINFCAYTPSNLKGCSHIETPYFHVYPDSCKTFKKYHFFDSFAVITVVSGDGEINGLPVSKYHSYLVKADVDIEISGDLAYIISTL